MRRHAAAGLVLLGSVAIAVVACSPFSGTDTPNGADGAAPVPDGAADAGRTGEGTDAAVAAGFDFDTCQGGTHVTEDFEPNTFPPAAWIDESYGSGALSRETTIVYAGAGALKGHAVSTITSAGASLSYKLQGSTIPRALRVRYAYKPVPAQLKTAFYVEVGCSIVFNQSNTNNAYFAYDQGKAEIGLVNSSTNLPLGFADDGWYLLRHELLMMPNSAGPTVPATLHTVVTQVDGGGSASGDLSDTLSGALSPIEIICGIPFTNTTVPTAEATLDLYVDDIAIDICP
jgi:hypothetical protein